MKNQVLIIVEGGVIQNVLATDPAQVQIFIRDFDTDGSDEDTIRIDGGLCRQWETDCERLDEEI